MTGLSPRLNLILNTALFCLWGMGFGMLSYYMSPTLGNYCNTKTWENDAGVMVCRIYKTLFTFTFLGLYVGFLLFSVSHCCPYLILCSPSLESYEWNPSSCMTDSSIAFRPSRPSL